MVSGSTISNDRQRQRWYRRRPILVKAFFTDLQKGSYAAAVYSIVQSIFMITLAIFDIYCLAEAQPGSIHYRYLGISFLFVYSGNAHVRNLLIFCSVISFILACSLLVTSVILMRALKKELEVKFRPWLVVMLMFTIWRILAILYRSIVNDLYFGYHQAMLVIWIMFIAVNRHFILLRKSLDYGKSHESTSNVQSTKKKSFRDSYKKECPFLDSSTIFENHVFCETCESNYSITHAGCYDCHWHKSTKSLLIVFMGLIVLSNYQELADITRLEDMAKLKMSTMSSLNQSHSLSRHSVDSVKQHSFSKHSQDSVKQQSNTTSTPKSSNSAYSS